MNQPTTAADLDDRLKVERLVTWTKRKIRTQLKARDTLYFEEREIWWSTLGENIGSEVNGKNDVFERPVVVVRKLGPRILLAMPITTKLKEGSWYFPFVLNGLPQRAILNQFRVISSKRLVRKIGLMEQGVFVALLNALICLITKRNPDLRQGSSDPSGDRSHGQLLDNVGS